MTSSLIEGTISYLNGYPSKGVYTNLMIPETVVLRKSNSNYNKNLFFRAYALVYTSTTTNMKISNVPATFLTKSNEYGGKYIMSLHTGKRIHSRKWEEIPINK